MAKSKTYIESNKKIDKKKQYPIGDALKLLREISKTKFDSSVEIHANCGIDTTKGEQQIRSTVSLPHGSGKTKKVAVFTDANHEKEAREAGADFIYDENDIKKIKDTGKLDDFEIAIAVPALMPALAQIAKILGPKGLMPNPKTETVTEKVAQAVKELKKGKTMFKNDNTGNVHFLIGRLSMQDGEIKNNFFAAMEALKKSKPSSSKGIFLKSVTLKSTMSPGIRILVE